MSVWRAKSVECTASTFPLVNVYSCAFYQEFIIKSFLSLSAAFWHLVLFDCLYLVAPTGVGPSTDSFPPLLEVQLEAGTHPVSGFFHCLMAVDD